jgi:hypothetical protein
MVTVHAYSKMLFPITISEYHCFTNLIATYFPVSKSVPNNIDPNEPAPIFLPTKYLS